MRKPSVLVIFLTVFIDLIGFGIIVPLIPSYSEHFGAHGVVIGLIFASYSAMQFIFSPIWGRLSDRYGRRPILLISTAGAAVSYVLFARSTALESHTAALWLMVVSRTFAGICGGNITVAQAYIADITPPAERSKKMGLIGMAFGLGFILGPFVGGMSLRHLGDTGPGWVAAAMCAANFLLALFILTESHRPDSAQAAPRPHLDQWAHTFRQPKVGLLVIVFFLATFCFSCFESTLPLLVGANFHLDFKSDPTSASTVAYLFVYCGLIGAVVQGGAIGRLVKRLGEPRLIALSLVLTALSMALIPFLKGSSQLSWKVLFQHDGLPWVWLLLVLALLSVGTSLTRPPLFGMVSNLTPAHEQGATIGVAQGAGSLARILGPIFATALLAYSPPLPYVICAGVLLGTTALVVQRLYRDSQPTPLSDAASRPE
jgi:DHA1 family tetracycline resistance protein-like MFS transporter